MTEETKMTNKECVERWAEFIIPAVFRAEDELLKTHPEWCERLANIPEDKVSLLLRNIVRQSRRSLSVHRKTLTRRRAYEVREM